MSYCQCKKCLKYTPPKLDKHFECKICGEEYLWNFAWIPGPICDECWDSIPDYIPDKHKCTYFRLKIKEIESEV